MTVSAEQLRMVFDGVDDAVFVLDEDMTCSYCNQRISDWLNISERELPQAKRRPVTALFGDDVSGQAFVNQFQKALASGTGYLECHIHPAEGASRWLEFRLNRVELDGRPWVVAVARDIGGRERRPPATEHLAQHDSLTGLPTRSLLQERIAQQFRAAQERRGTLALFIVSLDRFREINHILGPQVGDEVLRLVAGRLQEGLPEDAVIARHGGDEFSVSIPGLAAGDVDHWGRRISLMMLRSFDLGPLAGAGHGEDKLDMGMDVDFSIGVALYPAHGDGVDDLMRKAGVAAQIARNRSNSIAFYDREYDRRDTDRLLLVGQLRRAIAQDTLEAYFQPIVDLRKRRVVGVECQARWIHPTRGEVSPEQFIPLAEQTGLIRFLDHWMLEQALKQCKTWHNQGIHLTVAVNLSARTLGDPQLLRAVGEGVERWGLQPQSLHIEITESALMANPEQSLDRLQALAEGGVVLALDDFGTGYSSLAYLKRLPLECLKIDQSFVKEMTRDDSDAVIVRSTIELAHNLGLRVVAEGVEDEETWRMLVALGCDSAQGWHISPAVSRTQFDTWLAESAWVPV